MGIMGRLGLLVVFLFALCFNVVLVSGQSDAPVIAPVPCAKPGELELWGWDQNWDDIIEDSIQEWEALYCPGSKVTVKTLPWDVYWAQLENRVSGGKLPDVFLMSQDRFFLFAQNNTLLDMQSYFDDANIRADVWQSGMVDPYRWGDQNHLFAAPVNWDTVAIYYNKELFDAVGIPYPSAVWDWNGFSAAAAALTDAEKGIFGASVYAEYQAGYSNWIASAGVPPIVGAGRTQCTLTVTPSLDALNFLKTLYEKGYMPSVSEMGGSSADDAFNYWLSGKVAMITGGSWKLPDALTQTTFEWDVVQLPRNPSSGRTRSILHSVGYVASASRSSTSSNPDLAANLILYLISDVGQRFFADAGGVAPSNPSLQQQWIASFGDSGKNIQAFVDATQDSQGVTVFNEIWDAINTEIVLDLFDRDLSVNEAVNKACAFIDPLLSGS